MSDHGVNIIWAMDPTQNPEDSKSLVAQLHLWSKAIERPVQPVTVISNGTFNLPAEMDFLEGERFNQAVETSVQTFIQNAGATGFLPPKLLFEKSTSTRITASKLAHFAESTRAEIVFVNTRAKKTWNPFRLGSFAESLIATMRVPIFLMNPNASSPSSYKSVLFPTDFGRYSKNALLRLEGWAKKMESKILIFNQIETPTIYPSEFSAAWQNQTSEVATVVEGLERNRHLKARAWEQLLLADGVSASTTIEHQQSYLGSGILEAAKRNGVDLIAMASTSGPVAQILLGGVARDVMLQANCPVLIFHRPKALRTNQSLQPSFELAPPI